MRHEVRIRIDLAWEGWGYKVRSPLELPVCESEGDRGQQGVSDGRIDRIDPFSVRKEGVQLRLIKRLVGVVNDKHVLLEMKLGNTLYEFMYEVAVDEHVITISRLGGHVTG